MILCCCLRFWTKAKTNEDIELQLINQQPLEFYQNKDKTLQPANISQQRQMRWVEFRMMLDEQFKQYNVAANNHSVTNENEIQFIGSRLQHIKLTVKDKPKLSIVQGSKKYYYQLEAKSGNNRWTSFILFGELYDLAIILKEYYDVKKKPFVQHLLLKVHLDYFPCLSPLQYTSNIEEILENKVSEIQQWFDELTKEPYFLNEVFLKAISCPTSIQVGFKTYQEIVDSQYSQNEKMNSPRQSTVMGRQSISPVHVDYTYDIQMVQVDCYSFERSYQLRLVQNYLIKFYVQLAKQVTPQNYKRKQYGNVRKHGRRQKKFIKSLRTFFAFTYLSKRYICQLTSNLRSKFIFKMTLSNEKQLQIDKYLKALFGSHQYYCDVLFDEYGLVNSLMPTITVDKEDLVESQQVMEDFTDDFHIPLQKVVVGETNEDIDLRKCTVRVIRILRVNKLILYELSFCQYNETFDSKKLEVVVVHPFYHLLGLQRSISDIYEGLVYKLSSRLGDEEPDGRKMKVQIESFFLNILQLPRIKSHKPFMDCFRLWQIKEQMPRLPFYQFAHES